MSNIEVVRENERERINKYIIIWSLYIYKPNVPGLILLRCLPVYIPVLMVKKTPIVTAVSSSPASRVDRAFNVAFACTQMLSVTFL